MYNERCEDAIRAQEIFLGINPYNKRDLEVDDEPENSGLAFIVTIDLNKETDTITRV